MKKLFNDSINQLLIQLTFSPAAARDDSAHRQTTFILFLEIGDTRGCYRWSCSSMRT